MSAAPDRRPAGPARARGRAQARAGAAALLGLVLLSTADAAAAQGQVYKWKDAAGVVHYSDTPPPSRPPQVLKTSGQAAATPALPYELARAARAHPVTLYTMAPCATCDQGRALLRARGIPYAEKTVGTAEDQQQLLSVGGKDDLPLLVVGSRQVAGFQAAAWNTALDVAAYPKQSMLPSGYPTGTVTPAAAPGPARSPVHPPPDDAAPPPAPPASKPPPPKQAPTDFQF